MTGRDAIAKFYANAFKQNLSETAKVFEIHALGDSAWGIGEYDAKLNGPNGPTEVKGHWAAVYVPVGDEWKVRMLSGGSNAQPAPMAASGSSTSK
jgi:ketosteroid isomerase-like protein